MTKGGSSNIFNLGNGNGFSVREIIAAAQQVTGHEVKVVESDRRPGDPPQLVGSADKARQILGWQPQYANLHQVLSHAWSWHLHRHQP